jgi:hypothetical protein
MGNGLKLLLVAAVALPLFAQKSYTPPRTADGQPDLQGFWTNATLTPFERPPELGNKAFFTDAEAAAYEKQLRDTANRDKRESSAETDVGRAYNEFWFSRGDNIVGTRRTSLVIDPPDGRIPALTPAAQKRQNDTRAYNAQHPADGPENRSLAERCILWPVAGPPMVPGAYNNNYQIIQSPGYVTILIEMIHDARIIPLDGRPHLPSNMRQWMGDSRGHWDGTTLVVETTNFSDKTNYRGATQNMKLTERFTRVSPGEIRYEFTVDDPAAFTKPWTVQIPMTKAEGPIIEYACNEGNYGMAGILSGARAQEK